MSIRDRLAAKPRRRIQVPVQVSDPAQDLVRVAAARTFLLAAQSDPDRDTAPLEQELADAQTAVGSHVVEVEFQALPAAEFEALFALHSRPDDVDVTGLQVALAAACAVDEDLRDQEWWARQLDPATGTWTPGERDALYHQLLNVLHLWVPSGAIPKG